MESHTYILRRDTPMRTIVSVLAALCLSVLMISPAHPAPGDGTTLERTIAATGERQLAYAAGEDWVTRTLRWKDAGGSGTPVAGFKQVSDIHVVDSESPGRVEFFDRCSFGASAYRPQEALTTQVGESMIRALNAIDKGPATGVDLGFSISTGDNIDNNQRNELGWFIDLMNGETITPDSGADGYDGYTQATTPDALPDEILAEAIKSFDGSGIGPWYAVLGNHDQLVQGNLPASTNFKFLVTQEKKVFIDPAQYEADGRCPASIANAEDAFFEAYFGPEAQPVPADFARIFIGHSEIVTTYAQAAGEPHGHGLANTPVDPVRSTPDDPEAAGYYAFNVSNKVRGISMDTVSYATTSEGIINDSQFGWVEKQLKKNSRVYYTASGKRRTNRDATNKLIVLFSHHTSRTINQPGEFPDITPEQREAMLPQHCFTKTAAEGCAEGEGLRDLLRRYPNVIAWVNGHEHNNRVTGFAAAKGTDPARGFWEINTSAHIDWPQQSRVIEIAYKPGVQGRAGSIYIYGTVIDHIAAPVPDQVAQDPIEYLASVSRVESYYDACVRAGQASCDARGEAKDRNVRLVQKAPFDL
jgi:metallophosphoesterase (TIGR03767 family)